MNNRVKKDTVDVILSKRDIKIQYFELKNIFFLTRYPQKMYK